MTDKEAILSIIYSNFDVCSDVYENRHNLRCINFCTSCKYRDLEDDYPCWVHRIANVLLEAIPQFDCCLTNKKIKEIVLKHKTKIKALKLKNKKVAKITAEKFAERLIQEAFLEEGDFLLISVLAVDDILSEFTMDCKK